MTPPESSSLAHHRAPPLKAIYDVLAPAKLNLFLHITGRRADGYHLLQSVFMLIDWCDTLHFEVRRDGVISRTDLGCATSEILPENDLTVRAARALQAATGTTLGVNISLEKCIPSQAGMGGGSSDAASCLRALQRLWGVHLPPEVLQKIGLALGADVPFFLGAGHAWVEGIGEQLTPIQLPPAHFLVVKPPAGLSTPAIFGATDLKRDTQTATMLGFAANDRDRIYEYGRNDLQPVAEKLCSPLVQSLDWLAAQGLKARMTGSGSAVFAEILHDSMIPAAPSDWMIKKCKNLEAHPLAGW
jgi:4-diphosphocytidyl-2-C-methyl-D-erythritol kinase